MVYLRHSRDSHPSISSPYRDAHPPAILVFPRWLIFYPPPSQREPASACSKILPFATPSQPWLHSSLHGWVWALPAPMTSFSPRLNANPHSISAHSTESSSSAFFLLADISATLLFESARVLFWLFNASCWWLIWPKTNLTPSQMIRTVMLPLSRLKIPEKGKAGGICSGQYLTRVKIMPRIEIIPRVLPPQMSPKQLVAFITMGPARFQFSRGLKRKPRVLHQAHINPEPLTHPQLSRSLAVPRRLKSMIQRPPLKRLHHPTQRPFEAYHSCSSCSLVKRFP